MEMKGWRKPPVALFGRKNPGSRTEGVQKGFASCGIEKNLTLPVIEPQFSNHANCSQLTIMSELARLFLSQSTRILYDSALHRILLQ
jgi:hypothetical protein